MTTSFHIAFADRLFGAAVFDASRRLARPRTRAADLRFTAWAAQSANPVGFLRGVSAPKAAVMSMGLMKAVRKSQKMTWGHHVLGDKTNNKKDNIRLTLNKLLNSEPRYQSDSTQTTGPYSWSIFIEAALQIIYRGFFNFKNGELECGL